MAASFGFGSNVSRCDGPPAIVIQITRFAFCGNGNGLISPRELGRSSAPFTIDGSISEPSATAPSPDAPRVKNALRRIPAVRFCQSFIIRNPLVQYVAELVRVWFFRAANKPK